MPIYLCNIYVICMYVETDTKKREGWGEKGSRGPPK